MRHLHKEYSAEFGTYDKNTWFSHQNLFRDANIYQSWSYGISRYGKKGVAYMILKKDGNVVSLAQLRTEHLLGLNFGIAYSLWGPIWRRKDVSDDIEIFRQAIRALRNEFSLKRKLLLRIYPLAFQDSNEKLQEIFLEEGFQPYQKKRNQRTLIIDLSPSINELRSNLDQKWRNGLNRAEKNNLELIFGDEDKMFDMIKPIYSEMAKRKSLSEVSDIDLLKAVNNESPDALKLKVIICLQNGEVCAGGIFSASGETGVYLVGATSAKGLKANGSYLIQWHFLKWLKENRFRYYDLNGINPELNPGTYKFKKGLSGKNGRDTEFVGKFQIADNIISRALVQGGENLLSTYKRLRQIVKCKL